MNIFDIWLSSLKMNPIKKLDLLKLHGTTENIYKAIVENKKSSQFSDIEKIDYDKMEKIEKLMLIKNIHMVNYTESAYPKALLPFDDAPAVLYYAGNIQKLNNKSAALVGARNCS